MDRRLFLASIIILGVVSRLAPHLPNFTPLGAIALFSGYYFQNRNFGLLPLLIMTVSDLFISGYYGPVMFYVYGSFFLIFLIGKFFIASRSSFPRLLISSLFASSLFFVVTNFAVWLHTPLYTKDPVGLVTAYIAAIPFFRTTLLSDLFFNSVFFAAYHFSLTPRRIEAPRSE